MQKIILLFVLLFPILISAQTDAEAKTTHQEAEKQFMAHHPNAQKVDIDKLTKQQKDLQKKQDCKSCAAKNVNIKKAKTPQETQRSLAQLEGEQARVADLVKELQAKETTNIKLLEKYKKALTDNAMQIKIAEAQLARQKKAEKARKAKKYKN